MIQTGRILLYLSLKPDVKREAIPVSCARHPIASEHTLTNWPGTLRFDPHYIKKGRHNIAGTRYDVWFPGPDGHIWHGINYGENTQITHCKRTKQVIF